MTLLTARSKVSDFNPWAKDNKSGCLGLMDKGMMLKECKHQCLKERSLLLHDMSQSIMKIHQRIDDKGILSNIGVF
jgi:hypothetical protein